MTYSFRSMTWNFLNDDLHSFFNIWLAFWGTMAGISWTWTCTFCCMNSNFLTIICILLLYLACIFRDHSLHFLDVDLHFLVYVLKFFKRCLIFFLDGGLHFFGRWPDDLQFSVVDLNFFERWFAFLFYIWLVYLGTMVCISWAMISIFCVWIEFFWTVPCILVGWWLGFFWSKTCIFWIFIKEKDTSFVACISFDVYISGTKQPRP